MREQSRFISGERASEAGRLWGDEGVTEETKKDRGDGEAVLVPWPLLVPPRPPPTSPVYLSPGLQVYSTTGSSRTRSTKMAVNTVCMCPDSLAQCAKLASKFPGDQGRDPSPALLVCNLPV